MSKIILTPNEGAETYYAIYLFNRYGYEKAIKFCKDAVLISGLLKGNTVFFQNVESTIKELFEYTFTEEDEYFIAYIDESVEDNYNFYSNVCNDFDEKDGWFFNYKKRLAERKEILKSLYLKKRKIIRKRNKYKL